MSIDWSPLHTELALWRAEQMVLPLWWRDDDAIAATSELDRLARLSDDLSLPVHLAVIPAHAEASLATMVTAHSNLIPTVHGWAHENRAPSGSKKAEFGHPRVGANDELQRALSTLRGLFGPSLVPAFVAPWNRLHPSFMQNLSDLGYAAVSTFLPRPSAHPAPGLLAVNTHIDPIDWRGTRGLLDPDRIITDAVAQLQARRRGDVDRTEPFGYLTHHLVHTPDVWTFSHAFLSEMLNGGATRTLLTEAIKETK
ncbi:polysaccharide deacetylase family protein [uncultured Roseobacter sp.]|uniref:polysaccharide deacetylase family protein n=1 Tax=uncultured Roseobacter sp. TaxID=114847 RepID=UPI002627D247|nr:polysaccharide deacetylase family protein [uncultured Roseobacter sp.]